MPAPDPEPGADGDRGRAPDETARAPAPAGAPPPPPAPPLRIGDLIGGRYEILERHREGGMGIVFRVADTRIPGRVCALKMIKGGVAREDLDRFRIEVMAMGKLAHPHIVPVYDFDRDPATGLSFCVMKWVEGDSMVEYLQRHGRDLTLEETVRRLVPVAEAVHEAHGQGIVHRDIKTRNILVDANGNFLLADFGLARMGAVPIESTAELRTPAAAPPDVPGATGGPAVIGTTYYMSPEQALAPDVPDPVGAATDVWSLGVVLYELVTGRVPIGGRSAEEFLENLYAAAPITPPSAVLPGFPRASDLDAVCLKALARRPADRYASARELAEDLRRWLDGVPVRARTAPAGERLWRASVRHRRALIPIAAALLLALAAGGWSLAQSLRRHHQARDAFEKARAAEQAERLAEAREAYSTALMLDPANAEARAGLRRVEERMKAMSLWGQ